MDLSPYVEQLQRELVAAAEVGGDDTRALAERLTAPLDSALRLALLSALSAAAEELTGQLAPATVDVRLRGGELGLVVTHPAAPPDDRVPDEPAPAAPAPGGAEADEGGTSRITLRLPDQLKARVEEAADRQGSSVNSWLVRAVTRALEDGATPGAEGRRRGRWSGQSYSGWVR